MEIICSSWVHWSPEYFPKCHLLSPTRMCIMFYLVSWRNKYFLFPSFSLAYLWIIYVMFNTLCRLLMIRTCSFETNKPTNQQTNTWWVLNRFLFFYVILNLMLSFPLIWKLYGFRDNYSYYIVWKTFEVIKL